MSEPLLRPFRASDAAAIPALHARHAVSDSVDPHSVTELQPTAESVERSAGGGGLRVAERGGDVVGWGSLDSWTEDAGTVVSRAAGYVAPPFRRRGLGSRLLLHAAVLGGNATSVQPDR